MISLREVYVVTDAYYNAGVESLKRHVIHEKTERSNASRDISRAQNTRDVILSASTTKAVKPAGRGSPTEGTKALVP